MLVTGKIEGVPCVLLARWVVSFLYVPCRSVCDRDQIWINQSKPFLRGIKVTSELWKLKDQECAAPIWPLTCKKMSDQELLKGRSSAQAHFLLIKNLDPGHKRFNRWYINDYPLLDLGQAWGKRELTLLVSLNRNIVMIVFNPLPSWMCVVVATENPQCHGVNTSALNLEMYCFCNVSTTFGSGLMELLQKVCC